MGQSVISILLGAVQLINYLLFVTGFELVTAWATIAVAKTPQSEALAKRIGKLATHL